MIARAAESNPQASTKGVVEFEQFSAWFGNIPALRELDLTLRAKSITSLIGPSGCGKSTMLRAINRLNETLSGESHSGRVLLHGENIYADNVIASEVRQHVGMVFQRSTPFPRTVFENVAYGPRLNGLATRGELDDVVENALRRAALWDEVRDRLRESALRLSGGQQQRLCIARALANQPEVLLLDEPTSALDPGATQRIEELLYDLAKDLTIILVTHNLHQAARVSNQTVFLYDGRIVETGETRSIFTGPREPRTEAFITGRFG